MSEEPRVYVFWGRFLGLGLVSSLWGASTAYVPGYVFAAGFVALVYFWPPIIERRLSVVIPKPEEREQES